MIYKVVDDELRIAQLRKPGDRHSRQVTVTSIHDTKLIVEPLNLKQKLLFF